MMLTQTIPIYPVNKDYFNHFFTQSMKSNYEYPWTLKFYVILKSIEIILNAIKISDAKRVLCVKKLHVLWRSLMKNLSFL